jgi:hypothetical protein
MRYKCAHCNACPCCNNILITRATSLKINNSSSVPVLQKEFSSVSLLSESDGSKTPGSDTGAAATPNSPPQTQKVFYLMCGFCHWTTRESGIPDATISNYEKSFFFGFISKQKIFYQ